MQGNFLIKNLVLFQWSTMQNYFAFFTTAFKIESVSYFVTETITFCSYFIISTAHLIKSPLLKWNAKHDAS